MDTAQRTLCKAITWQTMGLVVTCLLGYAMTGSFQVAGGFALGLAALGMLTFFVHERVWARIAWGRIDDPAQVQRVQAKADV